MKLTAVELATRLRSERPPRLLDVRQPEEHALASIPGARLIPLAELPARVGEIAGWRGEEVVVYCHHGMRSQRAIGFLRPLGFLHLLNLEGGIDAWSVEVDPAVPRY
jgi:rhodanese-related sulfurtransferase